MPRFGPMMTAMVTPFDDLGEVDLEGAAPLARFLVEHGNDALVLTGSTGEASVRTDDEQVSVWRAVRDAVDVPLVVGSGTNDTRHAAELTGRAAGAGMDGVLVVTPYYIRPGQSGIEAHFRTVAAATDLPVIIYDIPIRTGRKIAFDVLIRLASEVDNVVAVKDATADLVAASRLLAWAPDGFELYSGDDPLTLPFLSIGAVGTISVAGHWAGREIAEMMAAHAKGDVARAAELNARLQASYEFETSEATPNPIPTKAMLRALGLPAGQCRMPLGPAPEGLEQVARGVWEGLRGGQSG